MTLLEEAIASGQVSADQIEAHRAAGDLKDDKTGWPAGMMQDEDKGLSRWLASKPDARALVREAAQMIAGELPISMHEPEGTKEALNAIIGIASWTRRNLDGSVTHIPAADVYKPQTLRETIDSASSDDAMIMCRAGDVRAALLDAERYRLLRQGKPLTVRCAGLTITSGSNPDYSHQYPAALDKALDTAIKGAQS